MANSIVCLPDAELAVMLAVWSAEGPISRPMLEQRLAQRGWAPTTLNSFLSRLTAKGFLHCESRGRGQGRVALYTARISRADYLASESRSILEKLYGSSLKNFVAAFCSTQELSDEELAEMQRLLQNMRERRGK